MSRRKSDVLFFLASLSGVGGIVASLRGTETMLYVAFALLGVGGALVAAGIVVDRVRGSVPTGDRQAVHSRGGAPSEDTTKVGKTRR
ncbi:MAG: hypothetical protein HYY01_01980 [Chloroflexi bacterium]|nr:hypothetical protein [Chloroflexota bacterium]